MNDDPGCPALLLTLALGSRSVTQTDHLKEVLFTSLMVCLHAGSIGA